MTKKTFIFLMPILLYSIPVFSEPDHYKNILVGDRAATMGGAYVGLSNDLSGTYYNPAGMAFADGSGISASANVYQEQHTIYKNAIRNND
ncbi:MAG: aromatic hydrocarbon degradation protein, partial [Proteobacteria bacterium]|nr:aromatic hydrocarbon degradation protein [Pseudomonadota bacterium]